MIKRRRLTGWMTHPEWDSEIAANIYQRHTADIGLWDNEIRALPLLRRWRIRRGIRRMT